VWALFLLLSVAAVLGDTVNYWIGKKIGPRAFDGSVKFLKQEHLQKTEAFYEKHGKKTIILARFVPIVRTFAPFVAGVGSMTYGTFIAYNVIGGVAWVAICVFSGYFFGNIPIVKKNFSLVVLAIIGISVLPLAWEWWKARKARGGEAA
jgi:membrane-associated protein